jgi:hypothetical protein
LWKEIYRPLRNINQLADEFIQQKLTDGILPRKLEEFISFNNLIKYPPILDEVPNILTGLGLLFTFVAISCGLHELQNHSTNLDVSGVSSLITALSTKFMSSIFGISSALMYVLIYNSLLRKANNKLNTYLKSNQLIQNFPHKSEEAAIVSGMEQSIDKLITLLHNSFMQINYNQLNSSIADVVVKINDLVNAVTTSVDSLNLTTANMNLAMNTAQQVISLIPQHIAPLVAEVQQFNQYQQNMQLTLNDIQSITPLIHNLATDFNQTVNDFKSLITTSLADTSTTVQNLNHNLEQHLGANGQLSQLLNNSWTNTANVIQDLNRNLEQHLGTNGQLSQLLNNSWTTIQQTMDNLTIEMNNTLGISGHLPTLLGHLASQMEQNLGANGLVTQHLITMSTRLQQSEDTLIKSLGSNGQLEHLINQLFVKLNQDLTQPNGALLTGLTQLGQNLETLFNNLATSSKGANINLTKPLGGINTGQGSPYGSKP